MVFTSRRFVSLILWDQNVTHNTIFMYAMMACIAEVMWSDSLMFSFTSCEKVTECYGNARNLDPTLCA